MSQLVQQIKFLLSERDAALRKADEIERQISEIRHALGLEPEPPRAANKASITPRLARPLVMGGQTQSRILAALAEHEPLSTADILQKLPDVTTVRLHLAGMFKAGQLVRHIRPDSGKTFWYARSESAFPSDEFDPSPSAEVIGPENRFQCGDDEWDGMAAGEPLVPAAGMPSPSSE